MSQEESYLSFRPDKLARLWSIGALDKAEFPLPPVYIEDYRIIKEIGEGGMGIVYQAEQEKPVKRQVALKIIKPGMDSKQVLARFEAERQALALMDHPNITHVFRAGTTKTGRPYFAMEYVSGLPITEYCDHEKLSIEKRLKLFIQICEAVQHAHQKGIIHRDIKPSNILVAMDGDKPVPKIIDFGIAKAISLRLTEETMFTQQGQLIGTPEYMSPEQADLDDKNIDTRTDVYSLGVVLYELLAGTVPFAPETLREAGFAEIQRIIREEEPPRPSTKLSSLGEKGTAVAQSRHIELSTLIKNLHKELEWIPLMAMRKERSQRYKSASDLAEDIQNYLEGNPLMAGPESLAYRAKKYVRRNKILVTSVVSILMILIVGIVTSSVLGVREYHARKEAEEARLAEAQQRRIAEREAEANRRSLYFNQIALIQYEYKSANTANVKRLLEECPEYLRNWEYDYLKHISDQSLMTIKDHNGWVSDILFSPDGTKIISASIGDKTVRVRDSMTGSELKTFKLDPIVNRISISPNGKQVITSENDSSIKLWDIENESLLRTFKGHKHRVRCIIFSNDGQKIASTDTGCTKCSPTIRIWDINTGVEILLIEHSGNAINSIDYSPDDTMLVACTPTGPNKRFIKIWNSSTGQLLVEKNDIELNSLGVNHSWDVEFDNTGKYILTANWGEAWVWDAETLKVITGIPSAHNYGSRRAVFSPDSKYFVTGGVFGSLKIWARHNASPIRTLQGHTEAIWSIAYSPDGTLIVSGDADGVIKVWNTAVGYEIIEISLPSRQNDALALNPRGTVLATGTKDGPISIWDTSQWKRIGDLNGHSDWISSMCYSPDGKYLVSSSKDTSLRIWDMESNPPVTTQILKDHSYSVNSVQYSPDGKYIVSGSSDMTIKIWSANSGDLIKTLEGHKAEVTSVQFTLDGKQIISGSEDNTVRIWETETGKSLRILDGHKSGISCVALAPNGKTIVSGDKTGIGIVWNEDMRSQRALLKGHVDRRRITDASFSKDGNRIFTGAEDGCIRVWDTDTGQSLLTLERYGSGGFSDIEFSPDGDTIFTIPIWSSENLMIISSNYLKEYTEIKTSESRLKHYEYMASLYYDLGNFEEAVKSNKKVIELAPDNKIAHNNLLKAYYGLTDKETLSVEDTVKICEKTNWTDWFYLGILASKYSESGNFEEAVKWQNEAVKLLPENVFPKWRQEYEYRLKLYKLGKAYSEIGLESFSTGELVAKWNFEQVVGDKVFDSSGNELPGKLVGNAKIIDDPERGKVLSLDGNGSFVDCGNNWIFDITGSITVTAWIKAHTLNKTWQAIVTKGDHSWRLHRVEDSNSIGFHATGISTSSPKYEGTGIESNKNINDSKWHHIVSTYDGDKIRIYVDGVENVSEDCSGRINVTDSNVYIGENEEQLGRYWNGLIDDVRIYSYAINAEEITKVYKNESRRVIFKFQTR